MQIHCSQRYIKSAFFYMLRSNGTFCTSNFHMDKIFVVRLYKHRFSIQSNIYIRFETKIDLLQSFSDFSNAYTVRNWNPKTYYCFFVRTSILSSFDMKVILNIFFKYKKHGKKTKKNL